MKLPTWHQCDSTPKEERTSLEQFIYDNEPADIDESKAFRTNLEELLIAELSKRQQREKKALRILQDALPTAQWSNVLNAWKLQVTLFVSLYEKQSAEEALERALQEK